MKELKCTRCGKLIEGFNDNHVQYLMDQHLLKHKYDKLNKQEEK